MAWGWQCLDPWWLMIIYYDVTQWLGGHCILRTVKYISDISGGALFFFEWQHFFTWSCTVDDVQAFFLDVPGVQFGCRCDLWRIQTAAWTKAPLVVVWIRWLRPGSLLDSNPLPWKNTMLEHASAARTSKKQEYNIILDVYTRSIQEQNRKMARSRI